MRNRDIVYWGSILLTGVLIAATGVAFEIASQKVRNRLRRTR